MKTILKYIITIAIIAGIVFGIVTLIDLNRSNDYLYTKISSVNFEQKTTYTSSDDKTLYEEIEGKLSGLDSFITSNAAADKLAYEELKDIDASNKLLFNYYYQKSALCIKADKSLQDGVVNQMNKVIDCHNAMIGEYQVLLNYLNNPDANYSYLEYYYDKFAQSFAQKQLEYSILNKQFSSFIFDQVYNNHSNSLDFIGNQLIAKANKLAVEKIVVCVNDNLALTNQLIIDGAILRDRYSLFNKTTALVYNDYQFLNQIQLCTQIDAFLLSEDKIAFYNEQEEALKPVYQYVYNYLFVF